MRQRIRGETAGILHKLCRRRVQNPADVTAVRKDLAALRQAGLADAEILEAVGDNAERLGLLAGEGGQLAVRSIDSPTIPAAPEGLPSVARRFSARLQQSVGGLVVHRTQAVLRSETHGAVEKQHKVSPLTQQWQRARLPERASLMLRVPAISRGGLAGINHNGDFEHMETYRVDDRAAQVVDIWQKPPRAVNSWENRWQFKEPTALPAPTSVVEQYTYGGQTVPVLRTTRTLAHGTEPLMVRAEERMMSAQRTARLVCERLFVIDPDLAEVLSIDNEPGKELGEDAVHMTHEYVQSRDASLAPAATAIVGLQKLTLT